MIIVIFEFGQLRARFKYDEREAYDPIRLRPFKVENPWFSGAADIPTFSNEELLATKLRALLQRKKGRDLIDLSHALATFEALDVQKVVDLSGRYLNATGVKRGRIAADNQVPNVMGV